jgi:hypothetical protein
MHKGFCNLNYKFHDIYAPSQLSPKFHLLIVACINLQLYASHKMVIFTHLFLPLFHQMKLHGRNYFYDMEK